MDYQIAASSTSPYVVFIFPHMISADFDDFILIVGTLDMRAPRSGTGASPNWNWSFTSYQDLRDNPFGYLVDARIRIHANDMNTLMCISRRFPHPNCMMSMDIPTHVFDELAPESDTEFQRASYYLKHSHCTSSHPILQFEWTPSGMLLTLQENCLALWV
jgi:hypothetical protein